MADRWLVSDCLLGRPCRYDGAAKAHAAVQGLVADARARGVEVEAVCPEELGGLGTPRPEAQLSGGAGGAVWEGRASVRRVADGRDVTEAFRRGAGRADREGVGRAILKARSPSCGVGRTWVDGEVRDGDGVFAARLRGRGVALDTEETI